MIDIESKVFDTVYNAITSQYPECSVYGEYVESSATFPAVTVTESNNEYYRRTGTEPTPENHALIRYEINVYSDKQQESKAECKGILTVADEAMKSLGFVKNEQRRLPNVDRTLYRMYARYEAVVSQPQTINGDTVYHVYRR